MPYKIDPRNNHYKGKSYLSGAKRLHGIDRYNKIIDGYDVITREQKMIWLDERHRKLFPEKYDCEGKRLDD